MKVENRLPNSMKNYIVPILFVFILISNGHTRETMSELPIAMLSKPTPEPIFEFFPEKNEALLTTENKAIAAAVADVLTTNLGIASGALESNSIVPTSPVGLVALLGVKIGLVKFADTLPEADKRLTLKSSSALWGGAAVNNLAVYMAAPPPFPVVAGVIMGIVTWMNMSEDYEKADILLAKKSVVPQKNEFFFAQIETVDTK